MKDYYEILDVPFTATRDEIKAQYKQLVRIYHPDRFRDAADKAYAEEKLKQINIAFQVLCGVPMQPLVEGVAVAPQPVAYPSMVDFGILQPGTKRTLSLQVGNVGGGATQIQLRCSSNHHPFHISKGKRLSADQPFPLQYEVSVDTHRLTPNKIYQEWLMIDLDGVVTRVDLRLQVGAALQHPIEHRRRFPVARRWIMPVLLLCVFSLSAAAGLAFGPRLRSYGFTPTSFLTRPLYRLQQNDLLFAVQEKDLPVLYVGSVGVGEPKTLGVGGHGAVGSAAGQRVAYIGDDGEVYMLELSSGQHRVVTQDGAPKRDLAWSPDGKRLAYLVGEGEQSRIGVYDVPTMEQMVLPATSAAGVSHYAWSPDGTALLFDWWQGDERRVYRLGVDGAGLQPVTAFDSWGGAWSADGRWVVVSSPQGLYVLDSQGGNLTQVSEVAGEEPSWSADGQWLAYRTGEGAQQLWMLNMTSRQATLVSQESVNYAWSPTGALLGYVTGRTAAIASGETPLFYLWTLTPGKQPQLQAEINDPIFHWTR